MSNPNNRRVFVAGATGAVGRRMCYLLVEEGYTVIGTTRHSDKTALLKSLGVLPIVVDVYDAEALRDAVVESKASVVIHQLTDLPPALDPALMPEARAKNARVREVGTANLVAAAIAAKAERFIAQSIAFVYAPGPLPYEETAPLSGAPSVESLERQVLSGPFVGVVLRYGKFYGPGTGFDVAPTGGPVHVEAAADAARRAITHAEPGIYNIAEEDGTLSIAKATRILKWDPSFRLAN